jgi:excisionase family DNA binding protein
MLMATNEDGAARGARPMRVSQVAARLGCDSRTVLRLIDEGSFPGAFRLRERGHWRVPREDVGAYLARRRVKASALA